MRADSCFRSRVAMTARERASQQRFWRITSALEAAFQIPTNDHLVLVLGNGTERCNREALFTWVRREVGYLENEFTAQQVPLLAERLHRTLTDVERGGR